MIYAHTNLNTYDICPKQYHHRYVLKDIPREPQTQAMAWGNDVHKAMESAINHGTPLPEGMQQYERFLDFGNYVVRAEVKLGVDDKGQACDFFAPEVRIRGVADVVVSAGAGLGTAVLFDWKTGKRREDPAELLIHAALLKVKYPKLVRITGHYVWLKDGVVGSPHDLSDTEQTLAGVNEKIDEIEHQLAMGYMPPKQGPLCPWCPVKSCEFHPEKK